MQGNEKKRKETKRNEMKRKETKKETNQNKAKQSKDRRLKHAKRNETKRNETKRNETKQTLPNFPFLKRRPATSHSRHASRECFSTALLTKEDIYRFFGLVLP